jgi:hypothetical protein
MRASVRKIRAAEPLAREANGVELDAPGAALRTP